MYPPQITPCYRTPVVPLVLCALLLLAGLRPAYGQDAQAKQEISLQLKTLTAQSLHAKLEKVLRHRIATSQDPTGKWLGFNIDQAEGDPVTIWVNSETKQAQLSGPAKLVPSWQKMIATLDAPANDSDISRLIAAKPGSEAKVRQVVNAIESAGLLAQNDLPVQNNLVAQNKAQQPLGNPALGPANEQTPARRDSVGVSLLGPVQIETISGTDILLLRGNPRDVQRVLEVIEDIERMSAVGEPEVEVVPLQHVESEQLAVLLDQIFEESLNSTKYGYGSLGVYPLSRPNSVLLIGLSPTMKRAKETIAKLDKPGIGPAQFETFPLKHAKADDARSVVENLFNATGNDQDGTSALNPKAQVIADVRTNSLIVRAAPRDLEEVRALIEKIDRLGSDAVNELRVFKLQSAVANDLENVLQEAFSDSQSGNDPNSKLSQLLRLVTIDAEGQRKIESGVLSAAKITSSSSANALIVSVPRESMPLMESLIEQLDQSPDAAIELKIFPVENGDAVALRDMLSELFSTSEGGQGEQTEITGLRVEVDERTNSVLVAGTRDDLVTVEAILRTLDSTDARQRQNRVYRLKNKSALDVAQALNDWLRAERDVQGTAPGTASPFQQIEREVVVVPELASNSLIVSATPRYYKEVARLIHELDAQDQMVMIQVLIAEIELGDIDEFGVELGLQDSVLFDRSLLGELLTTTNTTITNDVAGGSTNFEQEIIQSATNTPGFNFGNPSTPLGNAGSTSALGAAGSVASQALSSFGVNRVSSDAGFGGLVLSASSNSVSMLLRALQESRRMEVLSRPQIMTLDNQPGFVFVGQRVPFITSSTPNQITGQPTNSIEPVDVGLSLEVIPRISPDGLVVMVVNATNNRLRPLSEGVPVAIAPNGAPVLAPIQDVIEARTTVSAVSGQTVILSGLITKEENSLHRRVPILADIPLLGNLFRFDSVSTVRKELLIILTPHVIRNRFDAEMIKQVESARMNWCLSDVVDMHGPAGLRSQTDRAGVAEAETVFPGHLAPQQYLPASQ